MSLKNAGDRLSMQTERRRQEAEQEEAFRVAQVNRNWI